MVHIREGLRICNLLIRLNVIYYSHIRCFAYSKKLVNNCNLSKSADFTKKQQKLHLKLRMQNYEMKISCLVVKNIGWKHVLLLLYIFFEYRFGTTEYSLRWKSDVYQLFICFYSYNIYFKIRCFVSSKNNCWEMGGKRM